MGKLNALSVQKIQESGLHIDGNGLYLQVSEGGTKSWIFRFMLNKKARAMGLGPADLVSLAEARIKAVECRIKLFHGIDPIEAKKSQRRAQLLAEAKMLTFTACAAAYIESHRRGWKNAKHASQWSNTIATYANPIIGHLAVQDVDTTLVMKVLEPIWYNKTETASRLRNRIESILSWATVRGYRVGDNPALWRGHLDKLLPKRSNVQQVKHHSALPISEMPTFMEKLRMLKGLAPRGLEFQIITACRTQEVMGSRWSEINLEDAMWTIPAERMKAKREHRVPLSARAIEILKIMASSTKNEFIFPGRHEGQLSNNTFLALLKKRLNVAVTAHGFRSTFSDWAAERTTHAREVVEMSLAHAIKDQTEAAYRRGDLLLKRQVLMNDWAKFCTIPAPKPGKIIEIANKAKVN